jgi:hypothetical protein
MIVNKETISYVNNLFNLPAKGDEQDWAIELADKLRLEDFIEFLQNDDISFSVKYAVVELILASYDEYLYTTKDINHDIWKKITGHTE